MNEQRESKQTLKQMNKIELYEPSNGTDFDCFAAKFCFKCSKHPLSEDAKNQCGILGKTMFMKKNEKGYPNQWRYVNGNPVCTSFKDRDEYNQQKRVAQKSKRDKNTIDIFQSN